MSELSGGIDRFEGDDVQQFTMTATVTRPQSVTFAIYDQQGAVLPLGNISSLNALATVAESHTIANTLTGLYHIEIVVPATPGLYTQEWRLYDTSSRAAVTRDYFEIYRTDAVSFFTYGNVADILRTARVMLGRQDVTARELQDYMQPADATIDMKLGTVMTVPVTPCPILRDWNKVITLWTLYCDKFSTQKEDAPNGLYERYKEVMKTLTQIQSGNAVLSVTSGSVLQVSYTIGSTTEDYKPVFDSRDWTEMRIDPDLQEADESADE
jgi:phage gp36-like protein